MVVTVSFMSGTLSLREGVALEMGKVWQKERENKERGTGSLTS